MEKTETISAISTPIGTGGISVIRISGEDALSVSEKIFRGNVTLSEVPTHTVHVAAIVDPQSGEEIDQGVFTVFRAPQSYTGEDVVEVSCHGGLFVTQKVLQATLKAGARLAEPGEFTKRAFLNGKLDLSRAEAVADLIQAQTEKSLRASYQQLSGKLFQQIQTVQRELIEILGFLELELDFSEEDVELIPRTELVARLDSVKKILKKWISTYQKGRFLRDGVKMTIVGRPNVGKSSLLNRLIGSDRAIVDATPGTTRDAVEVQLDIDGVLFRVIDTAGLRQTRDRIEAKGVEMTQFHLNEADLVVFLYDGFVGWLPEDDFVWNKIGEATAKSGAATLIVENKIDLKRNPKNQGIPGSVAQQTPIRISAKTGEGMDSFYEMIKKEFLTDENLNRGEIILTNIRHVKAIEKALSALDTASETLQRGLSQEFAAVDVRGALNAIGEIVGETSPEDVLDFIFGRFCIGK
ncbi:MAG: tRNA uridine-5-carboxymethylaminomethyl(34) synthesis GTPase MnmE [Calditrichaeota bacterium]|nr:tRNA uridine-5-carboxymethylaminomethyl(34) synthesis GTPase MnmE [Calditrichota bacterium]